MRWQAAPRALIKCRSSRTTTTTWKFPQLRTLATRTLGSGDFHSRDNKLTICLQWTRILRRRLPRLLLILVSALPPLPATGKDRQGRLHHGDKHYTTLLLRLLPLPLLILPLRVLLLFDCACLSRLESSRSPATDLVAVQCQKCVHFIVKLVVFCQFTCWITSIRGHQERVTTWATAMPSLSAGRANCSQCKRGIRPQRPDRARIKKKTNEHEIQTEVSPNSN